MTKSRERSEASYSTSRAEQMAENYRNKEIAKIWHGLKTGSVAGETICVHYLAGMRGLFNELEKYAQEIKEAEFPATREQQIMVDKMVRDLGKMMEER